MPFFKDPSCIAQNLKLAGDFLQKKHPEYLFIQPLPTLSGKEMVQHEGEFWRLLPFIENSISVNDATLPEQAFEAAKAFGKLTRNLHGIALESFRPSIVGFHDVAWRFRQLEESIQKASQERKVASRICISFFLDQKNIVETYENLLQHTDFPDRLMHHDTKMNNVLLDKTTQKALAVCDLDTLMPGKIISDVGDMVRTYTSPVGEESLEIEKIEVRESFYEALMNGYLSEMGTVLTETEKQHLFYAGEFLIYMQGLRFLADFLNNDVYYPIKYAKHNLNRAINQMVLLESLQAKKTSLLKIIQKALEV